MSLFRTVASVALTAMLASIGLAQSGYYVPMETFPAYGAPAYGTYGSPPVNHAMRAPPVNHPAYTWPPTPAYRTMAANPARPDLAAPDLAAPIQPDQSLRSGLMDRMLAEASVNDQAVLEPITEPTLAELHEPVIDFAPMSDGCAEAACGACGQYLSGHCSPWYLSMSTIVLGRNNPNKLWTSYRNGSPPTNPANLLMNTHDTGFEWQWGNEIRFGRKFGGNQWALEAQYWTLYPMRGDVTVADAAGVSSTLDVSDVNFNGISGDTWFDNALRQRLQRRDEIHNVELNLIRFASMHANPDDRWSTDWSVGLRFFRFQEQLVFSSTVNAIPVAPNAATAVLNDRIKNSLFGFQVGCNVDYRLFSRWRLFAKPQIGIYNNHIEHDFRAYLGDGTGGVPSVASGQNSTYPVRSSVDAFSVLTQLDIGLDWQIAENWSAQGGYRMMVATGIGLSDHQIPDAVVNIDELAHIDRNGELILHGAFFNVLYEF